MPRMESRDEPICGNHQAGRVASGGVSCFANGCRGGCRFRDSGDFSSTHRTIAMTEPFEQEPTDPGDGGNGCGDGLALLRHELRAPLSPLLLAACLLAEDETLPPQARVLARTILRQVELEIEVVERTLRLAEKLLERDSPPRTLRAFVQGLARLCSEDERTPRK